MSDGNNDTVPQDDQTFDTVLPFGLLQSRSY